MERVEELDLQVRPLLTCTDRSALGNHHMRRKPVEKRSKDLEDEQE